MPSKTLTDAFVRNLTFAQALKDVHNAALDRWRKNEERLPKPAAPNPAKLKQVVYLHTVAGKRKGLALTLVYSSGGTKTFRVLTYRNGKPHSIKLGTYPQLSLKDAWTKAEAYYDNPKQFEAEVTTGTFKDIAEQWIKRHVDKNKLISKPEIERCLKVYVYPKWGTRKFLDIEREQVAELLDGIEDNNGARQADAVLAIIRGICNWYTPRSKTYVSPIVPKMKRDQRKAQEKKRKRWLDDDEIRAVWATAGEMGTFGALLKIALLTGQRREKVRTMRWDNIQDGVWTIPGEGREKGTAGRIKLSPLALTIIEAQAQIAKNPYVFAGRGRVALNSFSEGKAEFDEKVSLPHWTIHDLRRTCRKLLTRVRVERDVAELATGHVVKSTEGVYVDPEEYAPQIGEALQAVANEVERIINLTEGRPAVANVVDIRSRA